MAPTFKPDGYFNISTDPAEQINRITNRVKYIALSNNSKDRMYASINDALMDSDHAFQQLDQPNMESGQLSTNISPVTTNKNQKNQRHVQPQRKSKNPILLMRHVSAKGLLHQLLYRLSLYKNPTRK